ncbi:hypothetical protein BUZ22_09700 [Staphylococcus haemolyticus]|uniref:hypothetical protein n=1 Tax=Staphylococcus haemolyticus TaxID=1283 RepID=UPI000D1EB6F0|nr:hypothetical protein [Staphylococcus haemolyticus]PTK75974.1 hypothetical protein BUZ24_05615 [Staphylococcus haemolyticus]PTK83097.1 hypothetical protein BUZ21_06200 [Staphylococcus haemolyticus]PTK94519.1 hypothetical protein BUZ19_11445 [Staphylococcus haemolyticus]RIO66791.1 hypothetical protein BUZ22_09700 [Staphylococcus haemolyticus]
MEKVEKNMSSKQSSFGDKRWHNILLIVVGILAFCIFHFAMGVNVAYALMFLYAPLTIGIVNLRKIRGKDDRNH